MYYDIQKASLSKRFAAGLLDIILLVVLATGIGWGVSAIVDIDGQMAAMDQVYEKYETEYGIDFSINESDLATMPSEEVSRYEAAVEALNKDEDAFLTYQTVLSSILMVISFAALGAHLVLEFIVPLVLKNGQTLGKKIFGIGLMRKDGVAVTPFMMFVRSILGKCTVEVMLPLLILFIMFLGIGGILLYAVMALGIAQTLLLFMHPRNALLHDLMSCTVAVDISSQLIFPTPEALLDYQKAQAAEKAEEADY